MDKGSTVFDEIPGLYRIVPLLPLRRTERVVFDALPMDAFPRADAFDRVLHEPGAVSPGSVGEVARPWYMHPYQDDNLIVVHGAREVDVYSIAHGKVEQFVVTPHRVERNGKVVFDGPAMLVWPHHVFHRIKSSDTEGSAALNFAVHYDGFDIRTNFSIYDLNVETGEYRVIRQGHKDQPS